VIAGSDINRLLYKVAKAYYEDNLTQEQIGDRFDLSRVKVSRLLQQAREAGIVHIVIVPPAESNADVERELEARYGLDEAVVVIPPDHTKSAVVRKVGQAAADYLGRHLHGHEVLGLSWGNTLAAVVQALPPQRWPNMKVVQILGGLGRPEAETYGADLTHRLAQTLGARPRLLPAPGVVASQVVRDALLADPQIADTLALAAHADVLLVGIGSPADPASVVRQTHILTDEEFGQLGARGAVGDIALRFFDAAGQPIEHEIENRMIGLDLHQIKRVPRVVGVAGGPDKFEAISGALSGRLIDVLVTDDHTAARLLADTGKPQRPDIEKVKTTALTS
jgi:DNA-binding transcriptional regulator LsrR (DeoR family)